MKLTSTPKPIRFSFEMDGKTFRSLDSLKRHFNPFELERKIKDGSFLRWLEQQGEMVLYNKLSNQKIELNRITEMVYGLKRETVQDKIKEAHSDEKEMLIEYALKQNLLKLKDAERYYLETDPDSSIWQPYEEQLKKSRDARVINRLADVYKKRGLEDDYISLLNYSADKLHNDYAKSQIVLLAKSSYIDGFDVSLIRDRESLIRLIDSKRLWELESASSTCLKFPNKTESQYLKLLKVFVAISINYREKARSSTYVEADEYANVVVSEFKKYRPNPFPETMHMTYKIILYKKTYFAIHREEIKANEKWKNFDIDNTSQSLRDTLYEILKYILRQ